MQPQSSLSCPKSTRKIAPGRLPFEETQCDEILRLLREVGAAGVSRGEVIFGRNITQCGARVDELKRIGFVIRSEQREGEKYVRHVSESEPPEPKLLPGNADWYERMAGKPSARETDDLPLFAGERA